MGPSREAWKGNAKPQVLHPCLRANSRVRLDPGANMMPSRMCLSSSVSATRLQCRLHSQAVSCPIASRRFCLLGLGSLRSRCGDEDSSASVFAGKWPQKTLVGEQESERKVEERRCLDEQINSGQLTFSPTGTFVRHYRPHSPEDTWGIVWNLCPIPEQAWE